MKNYKKITKEESIDSLKKIISSFKEDDKTFEKTKYYVKKYEISKNIKNINKNK